MLFFIHLAVVTVGIILLFYILGKVCIGTFFEKIPPTLYLPFGFVIYQMLFWFPGFIATLLHTSWQNLAITVSVLLAIVLMLFFLLSRNITKKRPKQPTTRNYKIFLGLLVLIGITHGVLQIGFWNSDHAFSDNSFYLTIGNTAKNAQTLFATNVADGMAQSRPMIDYYVSTYELSMTYLSIFTGFDPTAFIYLVVPIVMSLSTTLIFFELFRKLLKKDYLAFLGVILFFITIYFSPNYRSSLDDYYLGEWFLYFNYTGKVIVRYVVMPLLIYFLMYTYERWPDKMAKKSVRNEQLQVEVTPQLEMVSPAVEPTPVMTFRETLKYMFVINILLAGFYELSPISSIYSLAIMFVFLVLLLIKKRDSIKQMVFVFCSALLGFIGLAISFMMMLIDKGSVNVTPEVSGSAPSFNAKLLGLLGVNSEHITLDKFRNFFYVPKNDAGYWFYRWANVGIVIILAIALIYFLFYLINKKKRGNTPPIFLEHLHTEQPLLIPFGIIFPAIYLFFSNLPPIMHIVTQLLGPFVQQRLSGSYIHEIIVISWLLYGIDYASKKITQNLPLEGKITQKTMSPLLLLLSTLIVCNAFIIFPARQLTYTRAMDQERVGRLRFGDMYYSGKFDYELLTRNPNKVDHSAEEIINALSYYGKDKIVAGTINQFFGLSHVRVYDSSIKVVKTRFSIYDDETLQKNALLLKYYLSPTDNSYQKYKEMYTDEDLLNALELFDVTHVVVIKSYKEQETYGQDIGLVLGERVAHIIETDSFYIYELA